MWNIFEHWWTALLIAAIVQLALAILHIARPQSRKFWHILIPIAIIIVGIGVERTVQTDFEKVSILIDKCLTATATEDLATIDSLLAPDYTDSCHPSKESAMEYARRWFGRPLIAQNRKLGSPLITLFPPTAEVGLVVITQLDPKSDYYDAIKTLLVKVKLYLMKGADGIWRIKRAELLEINNQPLKWSSI